MTVSASYTPVQVQGDNTELDFDFGFKVFNASDVVVALVNRTTLVATPQTLSTHYTVTLNTSTPGGTVHFITAPTTDYDVSIRRTMTLAQSADIPSGGLFREVQIENAFDKAMMIVQEHLEILTRTLAQSPYAAIIANLTLPLPVAGKSIGWNATATALVNDPADFAATIAAVQILVNAATAAKNAAVVAQGLAESAKDSADADVILTHADVILTHADVVLTHLDAAATALDRIATAADHVQCDLDVIATAADRVQTGLDKVATNADVVLTHADVVLTHADAVQTALDRIAAAASAVTAANQAAALVATSTSSNTIGTGAKTFTTQASKQFATGQFILIVDGDNSANFMHGQVTSYSGTALVVDVQSIGGSGTLADWTISVSGSRGAIGETGATGPEGANDKVKNVSADASAGYLAEKLAALYPSLYQRDQKWALKTAYSTAANRYTILTPNKLSVDINGTVYFLTAQAEIALSLEANWDTIAGTDYRTAANRAGKDFYIYACVPVSGSAPKIVLSVNSTTPSGYSGTTSRKIGGFHGLCVAVGTISGHTLTDFVAGDVLPASIWDLNHRPVSAPEGMVYSEGINKWVDIYLASGTGASTASVYAATITDTRDWNDFTDDGGAVKKKMLTDPEFQVIATGSNEATSIYGSGDPGTTGGHIDTASRRMISNIGVEDACGALWQWLDEHATMWEDAVTAGWYDLPGDKGQLYRVAKTNDVQLIAGGNWVHGVLCGSRSRVTNNSRWTATSDLGCRFCAEPV